MALLCMQTARRGGLSTIASPISTYTEVLRRRPDSLEPLTQPFCWSMMGKIYPGATPYYESPVFNFIDEYLPTSFGNRHIFKGHEMSGPPELTDIQHDEALDYLDELCGELHFAMELLRGDFQFVNNIVVMHTRDAFEDWPEPERKRHLWRHWLSIPNNRPLTPRHEHFREGLMLSDTTQNINSTPFS